MLATICFFIAAKLHNDYKQNIGRNLLASTPDLASGVIAAEYIGFDTMFDGIDVNEDGKISLDALCIYLDPTDPPPVDFKQTAIFYF